MMLRGYNKLEIHSMLSIICLPCDLRNIDHCLLLPIVRTSFGYFMRLIGLALLNLLREVLIFAFLLFVFEYFQIDGGTTLSGAYTDIQVSSAPGTSLDIYPHHNVMCLILSEVVYHHIYFYFIEL